MKNRFDFGWSGNLRDSETERERGGSATNSESGWCKTRLVDPRDSLIEEGISLCAKQAGRIGLGRDGSQPKIGGRDRARTLARIFVLAFHPLLDWTRAKRTIWQRKKKEKERKEGCRKDEGKKRVENWSLGETWSFVCGRMITVRVTMTSGKGEFLWEM